MRYLPLDASDRRAMLATIGVGSVDDIYSDENVAYRANIDLLGLMDASDAPVYVQNFDTGLDDPLDMFLHHALHALAVKARADWMVTSSVAVDIVKYLHERGEKIL